MDPSCLVSTVQATGGGVMVWGIFSWHTLSPLVPIEHRLNVTAFLSIAADHVHPFIQLHSIQKYLYSAFHETIVAKQIYKKLSFYNRFFVSLHRIWRRLQAFTRQP